MSAPPRRLALVGALVAVLVVGFVSAGCGSSDAPADAAVKAGTGTALNPSGKPQNEAEAAMAAKMREAGDAQTRQRAAAAAAMKAARSGASAGGGGG